MESSRYKTQPNPPTGSPTVPHQQAEQASTSQSSRNKTNSPLRTLLSAKVTLTQFLHKREHHYFKKLRTSISFSSNSSTPLSPAATSSSSKCTENTYESCDQNQLHNFPELGSTSYLHRAYTSTASQNNNFLGTQSLNKNSSSNDIHGAFLLKDTNYNFTYNNNNNKNFNNNSATTSENNLLQKKNNHITYHKHKKHNIDDETLFLSSLPVSSSTDLNYSETKETRTELPRDLSAPKQQHYYTLNTLNELEQLEKKYVKQEYKGIDSVATFSTKIKSAFNESKRDLFSLLADRNTLLKTKQSTESNSVSSKALYKSDNKLPSEPSTSIIKTHRPTSSLASFLHYSSLSNYSNPDSEGSSSESTTPHESQLKLSTTNNSASLSQTRAKNGSVDKSSLNPTNEDKTISTDIVTSAQLNSIMESSSTYQTTENKPDNIGASNGPIIVCDNKMVITATDEIVAQAPSDNGAQLNSNLDNQASDNQLQVTLNCHSMGNSSASSASSSSLSPPNQSCSTPHNVSQTSSPSSSNTTLKNVAQPNLLAAENNNAPKSETSVTPQNSRFIIKKIPQAELEKYKNTPNHQKTNNSTAAISSSQASDSRNSFDKNSAVNKEQSPDSAANAACEATKEPVKKQNTERKINKFTVKKVETSERSLYDPSNVAKPDGTTSALTAAANKLADVAINPTLKSLPENNSSTSTSTACTTPIDAPTPNNTTNANSVNSTNVESGTTAQSDVPNTDSEAAKQTNSNQVLPQSNQTDLQKEQLAQQQQAALNRTNSVQPRTNSMSEKNEQSELEREKQEQDLLEDEKPIDESPDKRFLKYDTEIGHGSFKTVYKGLDTESGVPVAWCELHDRKFNKSERQRFIEEAEMLKKLQHPNIVRFYDYWEDSKAKPKKIILVTELMTSGTLKGYVQRFKKQEKSKRFKVIKNFANQILKGLAYLHGRSPPVIHRDLKCDNVFVTGQCGQVKIGDLGLATLKKTSFAKSVIGTPEFMAPEMYSEQYDESIDVYAFGMCLLEMATGEYPYQECTKPFEIYKRVTQGIRPENYYRIDNSDLKELIDLCIRLKKEQRPTVKELVNHSWFMDSNGLNLELHRDEKTKKIFYTNESQVLFRLKLIDKSKHKNWPDNEAIEFIFDVDNDNPETIAKELKENVDKINDEDLRYLIQSIKNKSKVFVLEREDSKEEEQQQANAAAASNPPSNLANQTNQNTIINSGATSNASTLTNPAQYTNETASNYDNNNAGKQPTKVQFHPQLDQNNILVQQKDQSTPQQQQQIQQQIQGSQPTNNAPSTINIQTTNQYQANLNQNLGTNNISNNSFESVNSVDYINPANANHNQPSNPVQNTSAFTIPNANSNSVNQNAIPSSKSINIDQQQQQQQNQIQQSQIQPQQTRTLTEESKQQHNQEIKNSDEASNMPNKTSTEIPLKFTILDFYNSPETGEVVKCSLDVGNKAIQFKFGLNADTPQDITSRLISATDIYENTSQFVEIIQKVIEYINRNKNNQNMNFVNTQFTAVLNYSSTDADVKNNQVVQETNPNTNSDNTSNIYISNNANIISDGKIGSTINNANDDNTSNNNNLFVQTSNPSGKQLQQNQMNQPTQFTNLQQQQQQQHHHQLSAYNQQNQQNQQQQQMQQQMHHQQQQIQPNMNVQVNTNAGANPTGNMALQQHQPTSTNQSPRSNAASNNTGLLSQQPAQQQQGIQQNDLLKSLQEKQLRISAEINQLSSRIDQSSLQISNFQKINYNASPSSFQFFQPSQNNFLNSNGTNGNAIMPENQQRTYEDTMGDPQQFYQQNMTNIHVINHKQQTFATAQLMQNAARTMSIHECPDQNEFEMQLLNANTNNSSEMVPPNTLNNPIMHYTTANTAMISARNNITSPPNQQQAVFSTTVATTSSNNVNPNLLTTSITSPTVLVNKTNEINLYTTNNSNQIQHSQIQQTIQQIETSSSTSSVYTLMNTNESVTNDPTLQENQNDILHSTVTSINLIDTRNQARIVNQVESLLNMAMNDAPGLDQVDFGDNFEDGQIAERQLPQNQNILGNHQMLSNMDASLASTQVINHFRRTQEQQPFNNNDLAELGERLKFVLAKKNSAQGDFIQSRPQLSNQTATDMILGKQPTSLLQNPNPNTEYILPLSDQMSDFNGNNLIMAQQQAQMQNPNFSNFRVNFQSQPYQNQGNMIDYYMNPQKMNRTSSTLENFPNGQMNLLQSTLIDPSQAILQNNNPYQTQQCTEAPMDHPDGHGILTALNSENQIDLNQMVNSRETSQTSINNSSEKSIYLNENQYGMIEPQQFVKQAELASNAPADDSLGDLFIRHRMELDEVIKRHQKELSEYVQNQETTKVSNSPQRFEDQEKADQ